MYRRVLGLTISALKGGRHDWARRYDGRRHDGRGRDGAPRMMFALMDGDGDGTISTTVFQVALERNFKAMMIKHRLRSLPVMDADSRLVGIIAREDVISALEFCA